MKKAKQLLSMILSIAMLLSITAGLDLSAYADTSGDFEYTVLGDGTAEITKYTGSETNLTIPSKLGGHTVTSIGDEAFYGCNTLVTVTIPEVVKSIGNFAFNDCSSLTNVTISQGLTSIGNYAFYYCGSITDITIPESVTSIGYSIFYKCNSLTGIEVDINNQDYSSLDGVLFDKNKTILIQYPIGNERSSYTIPESVTTIGANAFYACDSLITVTIPERVTSIDYAAFRHCDSLTSIYIMNKNCNIGISNIDNLNIIPDTATIYGYKGSTAEEYAEKHGNTFVALDEMSEIKDFNVSNIKTSSFDVSFDKVNEATNYWVQLSKDGGKTWSVVTTLNTNKGTVSGLESNKDYQVRIRAYALVEGIKIFLTPWSNIQNVRTLDAGTISKSLAAPKNLVLSNTTTNGVTISFDKVSNADGYEIQYYHNGEWIHYVNTGYTSKAWTGWGAAGTFDIRVRAYVKSGSEVIYSSNWSEAKRFYTKPNQVTGVKTASRSADGTSLTITWDQQKWATGYCVYKRGTNNKWWLIATIYGPAENSYTITGLTPTYDYGYKVRAFKGGSGNLGAFSDEHSTYTSPAQPKLYSVISDAKGKLYVSWVYGKCQGYELMVSTTPNFSKDNTSYYYSGETNNKVTIKSLKSGTYYVRVRSYCQKPSGRVYSVWTGAREIGVK